MRSTLPSPFRSAEGFQLTEPCTEPQAKRISITSNKSTLQSPFTSPNNKLELLNQPPERSTGSSHPSQNWKTRRRRRSSQTDSHDLTSHSASTSYTTLHHS